MCRLDATTTEFTGIEISVVIPVRNEEKVIGRCLEALAENRFASARFEVIVIDNGSRDRTLEIVNGFAARLKLKILVMEKGHISALRNRGALEASGRILAFLDADCLAPPEWLRRISEIMGEPAAGICGAHYRIPEDATWVGRVWRNDRALDRVGDVSYVPAGDLIIRSETFQQLGGFDESIQTNEDFELCQRCYAAGWKVKSYPELAVIHLGTPRTLEQFFRKHKWHGTHVLRVFLRDPGKRKNRRVVALAVYTLAGLVGVFCSAVAGAAWGTWMPFVVCVVILVLPILAITVASAARHKRWAEMPRLAALYLTYSIARATALLRMEAWRTGRE